MDDRYELREKIGQGGIGSVHRAYDHNLGREVAIKRILTSEDDPSLKEDATKQLMVEAAALASLQHPNIVFVQDVGSDEEGPYVVMELINGKTLDEMIETAPLPWGDCREVAMQSLEALIAAQELNMIHSDLKPPNIMLTWLPSGTFQVKILDFGLAVLIHNQSQEEIEKMESMFGSISFMPPEQFERKVLDARSDLYSLGCCLYQALTGTYPFHGESGEEVMAAHLNHTVTPIGEICGGIPIWACQWIMWLINRNPDDRPESARDALANFIQNDNLPNHEFSQGGEQANPPSPVEPSSFDEASPESSDLQPVDGEDDAPALPPQVPRKSILSKFSKFHLKIAAASLLLLGSLFWMIKQRNDRIQRENTYNYIVSMAAADHVREVLISREHLQVLLESIRDSEPNANLEPAYRALNMAKASDATNIDSTIADFATTADLRSSIRKSLFGEVIEERDDEASAPALIRFSASAKDPDEAVAAIDAISRMAGETHVEGLLGVLSSTSQPKVREAAEALLMTIIRKSRNRDDLARLISSKKQDGSQASREALDRLMAFAKPQTQAPNKPSPTPKPNPAPKPNSPAEPRPGTPEAIKPFVEALGGSDDSKKIEAIAALGNSSNLYAHAILLQCTNGSNNANLKLKAIQAATRLNSSPQLINDGDQARQRWVQVTWAAKTPEEEKLVIDAISTIQKDWATGIVERMYQYSKSNATKDLAKNALEEMKKRGQPESN
jgi:serine/threonine protein kinase